MKPTTSRVTVIAVAIAAGTISGALVSLGVAGLIARTKEPHDARREAATVVPTPSSNPLPTLMALGGVRDDLSKIGERVERLEASHPQNAAPEPPPSAPPASFYHQRHEEAIRQHRAESIDPSWGPQSTKLLTADVERLKAAGGYELKTADCRTATCSATIEWPDRAHAVAGYPLLINFPFHSNCERSILLPEASQDESKVQATLLLDCNSWRADGAPVIPDSVMPPLPVMAQASR